MPRSTKNFSTTSAWSKETIWFRKDMFALKRSSHIPDGTSVDLFIPRSAHPMLSAQEPHLTDFAQTMAWLADVQVQPWKSKNAKVLSTRFSLFLVSVRMAAPLKPRLPTRIPAWNRRSFVSDRPACVSRISTTHGERASSTARSTRTSKNYLLTPNLRFHPIFRLWEALVSLFRLTSQVDGQRTHSLVMTLSSQSSASSHQVATEVFRRQFDLASGTRKEQQITIVDDRYDVFKDEDLQRIERVSVVVPFSARKDVVALLAA